LHAVLQVERRHSAYRFPGLGEVHFVQDADAKDPLVMLASMVGKYVRELLMARIAAHYELQDDDGSPFLVSGYNDPRTDSFVQLTRKKRREWGIPKDCFQRAPAESPALAKSKTANKATRKAADRTVTKTAQ
jgi:ribonuclease HII